MDNKFLNHQRQLKLLHGMTREGMMEEIVRLRGENNRLVDQQTRYLLRNEELTNIGRNRTILAIMMGVAVLVMIWKLPI